jgi:hypothetical protein
MGKLIKIFFIAGIAVAFAFAQRDTTAMDSTVQTVTTAIPAAPATGEKKTTTGTTPPKPSTNWSKIKDLFL